MDINRLKKQLIFHEGLRFTVYKCPAGKCTIGVGRNLQDRGITELEALMLLENDINQCVDDLIRIFPNFYDLTELRQHALVDMRFNLGPSGFRKFKRTIAYIKEGDFDKAAAAMRQSLWYKQVPNRAEALCKMMEGQ